MWTGVEECGCWDETNENEMSYPFSFRFGQRNSEPLTFVILIKIIKLFIEKLRALALEFKYKVLAPPSLPTSPHSSPLLRESESEVEFKRQRHRENKRVHPGIPLEFPFPLRATRAYLDRPKSPTRFFTD